jgi:hypothetical protein
MVIAECPVFGYSSEISALLIVPHSALYMKPVTESTTPTIAVM